MGTVNGSWWAGYPDAYGIPHSLMRDGTPIGYGLLDINGKDWKLTYKVSRRLADFQMHIHAENEVPVDRLRNTEVYANVFNALPGADRKSTRLNSSHVAISYAVICLKKRRGPKD